MLFPRNRTTGSSSSTGYTIRVVSNGVLLPAPEDGSRIASWTGTEGSTSTMHDFSNPQFRKRMRQGAIVMSDMMLEKWSRSYSPGTISGFTSAWGKPGGQTHEYAGDFAAMFEGPASSYLPNISGDLGSLCGQALAQAYARMNEPGIMGGETVLDLSRTMDMLRKPFNGALSHVRKIKRIRDRNLLKKSATLARATADAWLEGRYGWQPVLLDADHIIKNAHKIRASMNRRLVVRGSASGGGNFSAEYPELHAFAYGWGLKSRGTISSNLELKASAGVVFDMVNQTTIDALQQMLGARSMDMLPLFWEKIPYSFVADWFTNVGTWIQAIVPNPYVTVRGAWITSVEKKTTNISGSCDKDFYWQSPYPRFYGSLGSATTETVRVTRDTNPSLPLTPSLTFKPLSVIHSVDALSLLVKPIQGILADLKH